MKEVKICFEMEDDRWCDGCPAFGVFDYEPFCDLNNRLVIEKDLMVDIESKGEVTHYWKPLYCPVAVLEMLLKKKAAPKK